MRDYGKFLNQMAGNEPQLEKDPHSYDELVAAEDQASDIPMDSVQPMQQTGYGNPYEQPMQQTGYGNPYEQPMQQTGYGNPYEQPAQQTGYGTYDQQAQYAGYGAQNTAYGQTGSYDQQAAAYEQPSSEPAPGKRYSADAYEQASNYGYSTGMAAQPYMSVRERRSTLAKNSDESMILGIIGAVIGAALGVLVWYLIGLAGYISFLGGLAIVAGAFFGYLFLGKGFGSGGALVVAVIVILSVFVGTRLLYGHAFREAFQMLVDEAIDEGVDPDEIDDDFVPSLFDASFKDFDDYMDFVCVYDPSIRTDYNSTLMESYVFVGIAAIVFFARRMRK